MNRTTNLVNAYVDAYKAAREYERNAGACLTAVVRSLQSAFQEAVFIQQAAHKGFRQLSSFVWIEPGGHVKSSYDVVINVPLTQVKVASSALFGVNVKVTIGVYYDATWLAYVGDYAGSGHDISGTTSQALIDQFESLLKQRLQSEAQTNPPDLRTDMRR